MVVMHRLICRKDCSPRNFYFQIRVSKKLYPVGGLKARKNHNLTKQKHRLLILYFTRKKGTQETCMSQ